MSENDFDVAVIGTSLVESIVAAALSKAGLKVLHIDQVAEYGGRDASLSAIDLHHLLLSPPSHMEDITIPVPLSQDVLRESRQYAISLMPSIVPSVGPFINTLVNSNVARYVPFKLLDAVGIYSLDSDGKRKIKAVPGSKEDVFKNKDLGLSQKRKLMKFLLNSSNYEEASLDETQLQRPFLEYLKGKDVGLDAEIADAIAYALSLSTDPKEPTGHALLRLKKYIRATGRHGNSPFIVGHFGGAGEIAQGFCRACAVAGGTYILGRPYTFKRGNITATEPSEEASSYPFSISIDGIDETLRSKFILSTVDKLPSEITLKASPTQSSSSRRLARCIAILDGPVRFSERKDSIASANVQDSDETVIEDAEEAVENTDEALPDTAGPSGEDIDTALLIFPPNSLPEANEGRSTIDTGVVTAFIAGPSSMTCPDGKRVVYLYTEVSAGQKPEQILSPYLSAIQSLYQIEPSRALMAMFYSQALPPSSSYCNVPISSSSSVNTPTQNSVGNNEKTDEDDGVCIIVQPTYQIAEFGDEVSKESERVFWEVIGKLGLDGRESLRKDPQLEGVSESKPGDGNTGDTEDKVASMWPPLQPDENED